MNDIKEKTTLAHNILKWYDYNKTSYPWRKNITPYKVLVSEIMLQQTQAKTVVPFFNNWLKQYKNIQAVASTDLENILKNWEGLGYYARARNLHSTCKIICQMHSGKIPQSYNDLINFPGIGPYIAGAVLSIAYNVPIAAIDSNVKRVFSRLFEIDSNLNFINKKTFFWVNKNLCHKRPGDFNQAIMDLGRFICKPRTPKCEKCPISIFCNAYKNNSVKMFPKKQKQKQKKHFNIAVGIVINNKYILISKRKKNGLLGGLWEFPGGKIINGESKKCCIKREIKEELDIFVEPFMFLKQIKHEYSHFSITLDAFFCHYKNGNPKALGCDDWKWIKKDELYKLPFPKANHKLFDAIELAWNNDKI